MNPWFLYKQQHDAELRLYCFPHAGGNAADYLSWQSDIGESVEIRGVQLPGRSYRFGEKLLSSVVDAAATVCHEILQDGTHVPFAFFGHSLGALLAFEVARNMQRKGAVGAVRLFASGCRAPHDRSSPENPLHALPDAELSQALIEYNGTPREILQNSELMDLVLPSIRADLAMGETYQFIPDMKLNLPISVFSGMSDKLVTLDGAMRWGELTSAQVDFTWFDGDHFFVKARRELVTARVRGILARRG